jgi:hypothetical protein
MMASLSRPARVYPFDANCFWKSPTKPLLLRSWYCQQNGAIPEAGAPLSFGEVRQYLNDNRPSHVTASTGSGGSGVNGLGAFTLADLRKQFQVFPFIGTFISNSPPPPTHNYREMPQNWKQ